MQSRWQFSQKSNAISPILAIFATIKKRNVEIHFANHLQTNEQNR